MMNMVDIIQKKKDGTELSAEEIKWSDFRPADGDMF